MSDKMPLILLSPNIDGETPNEKMYNNDSYFRAMRAGGGIPCTCGNTDATGGAIPGDYDYADQLAQRFDGLLITGGLDVDPHLYTQDIIEKGKYDLRMDILDKALLDAFIRYRKPVFGICRGIQYINVHFGGTLIQDIETELEIPNPVHNMWRRDPVPVNYFHAHQVTLTEGSELQRILDDGTGSCQVGVNSYHHQALKKVADGFKVTAVSDDGLIEGIESIERLDPSDPDSPPLIFAVQWHPERMIMEKTQLRLFQRFAELCSR